MDEQNPMKSVLRGLITPPNVKAKALDVLRQLNGLTYADALLVLDVAQRSMGSAVERLHAEQVFSPPAFKDMGGDMASTQDITYA